MSPKDNNKQVSDAIRILQREGDVSARATHLKATDGNVPSVTIERKIMSTKTSIKRIALVAAAALALGGVSIITASSANAAVYTPVVKYSNMYDLTNGYQVVGGQASVTIAVDTGTITTVSISGAGAVVSATRTSIFETLTSVTGSSFQINPLRNITGGTLTLAESGNAYSETATVVLSSAATGTTTITVQPLNTDGTPGTAVTKTVTWTASGTLAASAISTVLVENTGATIDMSASTDSTVPLYETASNTVGSTVAGLRVLIKDQNGNGVNAATFTAIVTGPGVINTAAGTTTAAFTASTQYRALTGTTSSSGYAALAISADGSAGVTTITITSGTATATKSLTFVGSAKTYTPAAGKGYFAVATTGSSSTDYGVAVVVKDSAGNLVKSGTVYASSSATSVATVSASASIVAGYAYFAVTGVTAGKATITFTNATTAAATTITSSQAIEVTSGTADTVEMSFDKASYNPGEKVSLQVKLTNAAGRPIADGTYEIFYTGLSANLQTQPDSSGGLTEYGTGYAGGETSVTTTAGVAELNFFAPVTPGTITITATTLKASTSSSALSQNVRAKALSVSAEIASVNAVDPNAALALDAANAATDAANNAYDEAQNATQAASDALAAVTALAAQVKSLIASVKKLTAAVAKLKK